MPRLTCILILDNLEDGGRIEIKREAELSEEVGSAGASWGAGVEIALALNAITGSFTNPDECVRAIKEVWFEEQPE